MAKINTYPIVDPNNKDTVIGTRISDGVTVQFEVEDFDKTYRHVQMIPLAIWEITHSLNKYPAIAVVDTSGRVVVGEVDYLNLNTVRITLSAAMGGEAYFN